MIKKTETVKVYEAEDGTRFFSEEDCLDYEKKVLSRLKQIKCYKVFCSPDFTEGRGFQQHMFVAVEADYGHQDWLKMLLQAKLGPQMDWCYHHPNEIWNFTDTKIEDYTEAMTHNKSKRGYSKLKDVLFLSHHGTFKDFPVPIYFKNNKLFVEEKND